MTRRLPIARATLASLIAALLLPQQAAAYEFICSGWRITGYDYSGCPTGSQDPDYQCDCDESDAPRWETPQLSISIENQGGNGITAAQFVDAAEDSAEAWRQTGCMSVQADETVSATDPEPARWGNTTYNREYEQGVFFVDSPEEWYELTGQGAGGALGVTVTPWAVYGGCQGRFFRDADILINGFIQGGWTESSLLSTVMHEIGHALGLGHPCLLGTPSGCSNSCPALMGATGGEYSAPQSDDIDGLCALYGGAGGGLGASCSADGDCDSGPCIQHEGFQYCSKTCSGSCAETGYTCEAVSGEGDVCVREGAPGVGEDCSGACAGDAVCVNGTCYATCASESDCATDERCAPTNQGDGVCVPDNDGAQGGEACTGGDCASGYVCVAPSEDASQGVCRRTCNPSNPASCGSGYVCFDAGQAGVCYPAASEGQDCEATGGLCEAGLECAPNDAEGFSCRRRCEPNGGDECGPNQECVGLGDGNGNIVTGACYASGNAGEGDSCVSQADCGEGLLCVGTGGSGGTGSASCFQSCEPSNPSCPYEGQSCEALQGGGGFCTPAGGNGGCACDTDNTCQSGCICDADCDGSSGSGGNCGCDTTAGCDANCSCDADCANICACDATTGCDAGCGCDPECPCVCDSTTACDTNCEQCDPDCAQDEKVCPCDGTTACDANCPCDPECEAACTCDKTTACDPDCSCDPECGGGCQSASGAHWLAALALVLGVLGRRRQRQPQKTRAPGRAA